MTRKGLELSRWQTRVDKIHVDILTLKGVSLKISCPACIETSVRYTKNPPEPLEKTCFSQCVGTMDFGNLYGRCRSCNRQTNRPKVEEIQRDAAVCRYLFTAKLVYMFWTSIVPIIRSI